MNIVANQERLSHGTLLRLKRWNIPAIYNGWEQITRHDARRSRIGVRRAIIGACRH